VIRSPAGGEEQSSHWQPASSAHPLGWPVFDADFGNAARRAAMVPVPRQVTGTALSGSASAARSLYAFGNLGFGSITMATRPTASSPGLPQTMLEARPYAKR
jgi:hypothetical protein